MASSPSTPVSSPQTLPLTAGEGMAGPTKGRWQAVLDSLYKLSGSGDWSGHNDDWACQPPTPFEDVVFTEHLSEYGPRFYCTRLPGGRTAYYRKLGYKSV